MAVPRGACWAEQWDRQRDAKSAVTMASKLAGWKGRRTGRRLAGRMGGQLADPTGKLSAHCSAGRRERRKANLLDSSGYQMVGQSVNLWAIQWAGWREGSWGATRVGQRAARTGDRSGSRWELASADHSAGWTGTSDLLWGSMRVLSWEEHEVVKRATGLGSRTAGCSAARTVGRRAETTDDSKDKNLVDSWDRSSVMK